MEFSAASDLRLGNQLAGFNLQSEPAAGGELTRIRCYRGGAYVVSIIDAHEKGGPTHIHLQSFREEK